MFRLNTRMSKLKMSQTGATRSQQVTPLCDMMAWLGWGREKNLTSSSLKGIKVRATGGQKTSVVTQHSFTVIAKEVS